MADFSTVVVTQATQAVVLSTVQQVVQVNSSVPGSYDSVARLGLGWFDVTDPIYGAVGDGVTDDTAAFEAAFAAVTAAGQGTVFVPNTAASVYVVGPLFLPSQCTFAVSSGVTVYARAGFQETTGAFEATDCLISIHDATNVTVAAYGATFKMRKADYSGQHRHCFSLRGCSKVKIYGATALESGGDGFFFGKSNSSAYAEDVTLVDVVADNNLRQGISVTSGKNIDIVRPWLKNTTGTDPQAGIDIEPDNDPDDEVDGIRLVDAIIDDCTGPGVLIALFNYAISATADKRAVIDIIRPRIANCSLGVSLVGADVAGGVSLTGRVNLDSVYTEDTSNNGIYIQDWDANLPPVYVNKPTVVRPNSVASGSSAFGSGIAVIRDTVSSYVNAIGNVVITNPTVMDDRAVPLMTRSLFVQDAKARAAGSANVVRVSIVDPVRLVGATLGPDILFDGVGSVTDAFGQMTTAATAAQSIRYDLYSPLFTNTGAAGTLTHTLSATFAAGAPTITFLVTAAFAVQIDPDASSVIRYNSGAAGKYLYSSTPGSRVTLQRSSTTSWDVVAMTGVWNIESLPAGTTGSRFIGNGTAHVAGDYALSAGWGNTATVSTVAARDTGGRVSITCGGSGIAANPTVTLTFKDGTWTTVPSVVVSRGDINAPATAVWVMTTASATAPVFTFLGTPVAGTIYVLDFNAMGK